LQSKPIPHGPLTIEMCCANTVLDIG